MCHQKTYSRSVNPCSLCVNGILTGERYFPFCNLIGPYFCSCVYGREAFKKWYSSEKVQQSFRQKRQKKVEKAIKFSDLPSRNQDKTLEILGNKEKQILRYYLDNFPKLGKEGCGIYLWSKGNAKTCILSILCREIIEKHTKPCVFLTERQIFQKIKESFNNPESRNIPEYLRSIDCLFIDNLIANSKITSWRIEEMTDLIEYRFNHRLPTFFASNYSIPDYHRFLANSHTKQIPTLIQDMCRNFIIEIKHPSLPENVKYNSINYAR